MTHHHRQLFTHGRGRGRTRIWYASAAAFVVLTAACSGGGDDAAPSTSVSAATATAPTPTTTSSSTSVPAPATSTTAAVPTTTTTLVPIPRQPLTGAVLGEGEQPADRPALAVKIDNAPSARSNHSGLAVADIVYEEIVEGSITRFAAVFHSQGSETVGPIRSGRSQDVDLLASFVEPLFAWSGGNPGVERLIADSTLTDLNWQAGGRGYYRGPGSTPHNLYNDTETLWSQTPEGHPGVPPPQQFEYLRPGAEFEGEPTSGVELPMRGIDVEWSWDAEQGRFLRSQQGNAHVDVVHGRIGAENVLVLGTWYRPSAIDARSPEAQTITQGAPLWVFSDGRVQQGQWIRTEPLEPMRLVDEAGAPILLRPGITWVELAEGEFSGDPGNPVVEIDVLPAE